MKNEINAVLENMTAATPEPEDYTGEDGLLSVSYTHLDVYKRQFWGRVQLEVVSALLSEKYKLETVVKEPSVIYMERPLKAASHTRCV